MLKTGFIGRDNEFNRLICSWLSQHTDLEVIVWTSAMAWSKGTALQRVRKTTRRFLQRARKMGLPRAINEIGFYALYGVFLLRPEQERLHEAVEECEVHPRRRLESIRQLRPGSIKSPELAAALKSARLDAMFSMCIDVYLPQAVRDAARHGIFLWHEGITPEYRGVYSPFWALVNEDYRNIGYTLLKVNDKLDAGDIYIQARALTLDPTRDWHTYIGHKAILESLPEVEIFLEQLESGRARPIARPNAVDGFYSYPTATALLRLAFRRWKNRWLGVLPRGQPQVGIK
jgi:Methionyl-tRNA formyltransferase